MQLPLSLLIERMTAGQQTAENIQIHGIRLLSTQTRLQCGVLYLGDRIPEGIVREQGSAVVLTSPCVQEGIYLTEKLDILLNKALEVWEQYTRWQEQFCEILQPPIDLQALVQLLSVMVGNPAYIVDASFKVLAIDQSPQYVTYSEIWRHHVVNHYVDYEIVTALVECGELERLRASKQAEICHSQVFAKPFLNLNLQTAQAFLGHLFVVAYNKPITAGERDYINLLATRLIAAVAGDFAHRESSGKQYENFILHMLDGTVQDPQAIEQQLHALGWQIHQRFCVLEVETSALDATQITHLCAVLDQQTGAKSICMDRHIVSIAPRVEGDDYLESVTTFLQKYQLQAGISDVFCDFRQLKVHAIQAEVALAFGQNALTSYQEIAHLHLCKQCKDIEQQVFAHKAVTILVDYDAIHGTNYAQTLQYYLQQERNLLRTAQALYIHKNTLLYRVGRIEKLTQIDLDDTSTRARILLTFWQMEAQKLEKLSVKIQTNK